MVDRFRIQHYALYLTDFKVVESPITGGAFWPEGKLGGAEF